MQLQWIGQFGTQPCPPGYIRDPFSHFCAPTPQTQLAINDAARASAAAATVLPTTTIEVARPAEEKNRTLIYAGAIVAAGIVTALALSRFA